MSPRKAFTIDSHIPIPTRDGRTLGRKTKYPWGDMNVGDSILFDENTAESAVGAAYSYGQTHGWKFTQKRDDDGVRVWRIK